VLSKQGGNKHDYDHSSLLLHKDCEKDHFPMVLDWILAKEGGKKGGLQYNKIRSK